MAGLFQAELAAESRQDAAVENGPAGDGSGCIHLCNNALVSAQRLQIPAHLGAEGGQDAPDFVPLFQAQPRQVIAPGEGLGRLDKQGLAAVG